MDYFRALRTLALADVTRDPPAPSYALRRIFRWYSSKFATPLHLVDDLPLHDVLQHYYEAHFEEMDDVAIHQEVVELSKSPEALAAERDQNEYEEYLLIKEEEQKQEAQKKRLVDKKPEIQKPKVWQAPEAGLDLQTPVRSEVSFATDNKSRPALETPDISMRFVDLEELEEVVSLDGLGSLVGIEEK